MATRHDKAEIQAKMHGLLGQQAWWVRRGQGSFLTMEFGRPVPPAKFGEVAHGEWHLWLYGCAWRLDEPVKIEKVIQRLEGRALQSFDLQPPALDAVITFEEQLLLRLFSVNTEEMESWMLFTPDKVITVGPAGQWSYGE